MNFEDWSQLSSAEQKKRCQSLNPYEDWPLFKSIKAAFEKEYGEQSGVANIFCGVGSGLGHLNAISVSINKGAQPVKLPEFFMGFPVLRNSLWMLTQEGYRHQNLEEDDLPDIEYSLELPRRALKKRDWFAF